MNIFKKAREAEEAFDEAWEAREKAAWYALMATPAYKDYDKAWWAANATLEYKIYEEAREQGSSIRKHTRGRWEAYKEYFKEYVGIF